MIRKDVMRSDLDRRVVKWALTASAVALLMGWAAEAGLERHAGDSVSDTTVIEKTVETTAPVAARIAG